MVGDITCRLNFNSITRVYSTFLSASLLYHTISECQRLLELLIGRLAHVDVIREDVDDITQNLSAQIWAGADILKLLQPVEHLQNKWFYILLSIIKVQSVEVNLSVDKSYKKKRDVGLCEFIGEAHSIVM